MPQIYGTLTDLLQGISDRMTTNGNHGNTGQTTRELLRDVSASLMLLAESIPPEVVNSFPPWDDATTYQGGDETVVRHDGKLWLFVSNTDNTATEPGTDGLVWTELSGLSLAHFRNQDTVLDEGGLDEVTAHEIRMHLDSSEGPSQSKVYVLDGTVPLPPDAGTIISGGVLDLDPSEDPEDNTDGRSLVLRAGGGLIRFYTPVGTFFQINDGATARFVYSQDLNDFELL